MNDLVGNQKYVTASLDELMNHLGSNSSEVQKALSAATALTDPSQVEAHRQVLLKDFSAAQSNASSEVAQKYVHYASRFSSVGIYQSVLSKLFADFPELQGYGDRNLSWALTLLEEIPRELRGFFGAAVKLRDEHVSVLQAMVELWNGYKLGGKATYPSGTPTETEIPERITISLLADWGGDNPAAIRVAKAVNANKTDGVPLIAIHLGDIYYGGVKPECESFLRLWPLQGDSKNPGSQFAAGTSYALNGNHEMYSGGGSYFHVVLKAFNQTQPFFCLQNKYWRIIGLDTAYNYGSLKPSTSDDPIALQWHWLIDLLSRQDGRKNILLTHHQPLSAHSAEQQQSEQLRGDVAELLGITGVPKDAIFGWFFGHEHRCALYDNTKTPYNARLIGSGCIPHQVQTEVECDPGCTPFVAVNRRGERGTDSAISMYAMLNFYDETLQITYVDEDGSAMGSEDWFAYKSRLEASKFAPASN